MVLSSSVAGWLAFYHFTLAHRIFLSGNTGSHHDFTRCCGCSILYLSGSLLIDNYIAFSFGVIKKHCYERLCMSIFMHFSNYFLRIKPLEQLLKGCAQCLRLLVMMSADLPNGVTAFTPAGRRILFFTLCQHHLKSSTLPCFSMFSWIFSQVNFFQNIFFRW